MSTRQALQNWIIAALRSHGGSASIVNVAKYIWANHEIELRASGDLFYTWQYDMRWACTKLRQKHVVQAAELSDRGEWKLIE